MDGGGFEGGGEGGLTLPWFFGGGWIEVIQMGWGNRKGKN